MIGRLQQWATDRGYRIACGDAAVLREVRSELEQRRQTGELDSSFADKRLTSFRYEQSDAGVGPGAVIMVAFSRPAHRVTFEWQTGPFEAIVPPTYVRYSGLFEEILGDMAASIPGLAGHLGILLAPLKPIACRLGLALYGRNNITYISGWGSYFQLCGFITDADLGLGTWHPEPVQLMPECEGCEVCVSVCPTGAINDDRVLLHAECCTTYFSEEPGTLERNLSARCLFGCLECQEICPVNRGLLQIEPTVSFSRLETELILDGRTGEATPESAGICRKLESLGMSEEPLIGRNLAKLIGRA
jgi:epoxyqueuosine reductase